MHLPIALLVILELIFLVYADNSWTPIRGYHHSHRRPTYFQNTPFFPGPSQSSYFPSGGSYNFSPVRRPVYNYPKVNLFTPNTLNEPPETLGQIENYNKALEEEQEEAIKEFNKLSLAYSPYEDSGIHDEHEDEHTSHSTSYVRVSLGGHGGNLKYGYTV